MMHDNDKESFLRKVYSIIIFQLLLTIVIVAVVVFVPPVANFFNYYDYVLCMIARFSFMHVDQKHPLISYFLLLIFTVSSALLVGLTSTLPSGNIILEIVALTIVVVISLSLFTFWAAKRGHDFNFLGPFLFKALLGLFIISLIMFIQIWFPLGKLSTMIFGCFSIIFGCLASIIFDGFIIYDIDNIIKKRFSYAQYISVSVSLYKDIIFIFLSLLTTFGIARWIKINMY